MGQQPANGERGMIFEWVFPHQAQGLDLPLLHTHQGVCIQEDTFAVMGERPAVKLGEGDSEVRSLQKGQVDVVRTVY